MNREELGLETEALALDCSIETCCQHRHRWKPLEKEYQCGWKSFIAFAALCARRVISESRSLEVERKVGGKFHLKLNTSLKPIANKYHEGKMKRTLKRGLKVFEIVERKVKWTSSIVEIDMCIFHMLLLNTFVNSCSHVWKAWKHDSFLLERFCFCCSPYVYNKLSKWFFSTRLETRTKESSTCASSQVINLCAKLKWQLESLLQQPTNHLGEVWVWAFVLGPERWWTMLAKGKVRGNSDGGS